MSTSLIQVMMAIILFTDNGSNHQASWFSWLLKTMCCLVSAFILQGFRLVGLNSD